MPKYELSITKDYAPDWTVVDSIRELFQNALDQQIVRTDNPMFWSYENGVFKVGNAKSVLATKSLLLGASTKSDDDETIGKFGEGYKIATLVLTRLGKKVKFYNYGARELWSADFNYSKKYGTELLMFNVDKKFPWTSIPDNDLTIEVEGITEDEMQNIIESNLHMQEYKKISATHGEVLLDEKHRGKMFVNGLYISEVQKFHYGYNFKPSRVKLDRDRKLIEEFDLKWTTSQLWSSSKDEEMVKLASELVLKSAPDVSYIVSASYSSVNDVSRTVANEFVEEYGALAVPVSTQQEADSVPKTHKPIIVSENVASMVRSSYVYKEPEPVYIPTFLDKVELWLITHGSNIKRDARRELSNLIHEEKENKAK